MNAPNAALTSRAGRECWLSTLELALREVFELMLACPLEVPTEQPSVEGLDITSMVGLSGQLCGVVTVRCRAKSASRMAARMLGTDEAGSQMWDAVAEICNMVAGNFKNKISGLGDGCQLSVPTVVAGGNYRLHRVASDEIRTVMLFEGEPIVLTLEVHS
jgi:chemotaxis protein CheX